jgi:ABC-type multidrug transport system ATPase subunit
MPSTSQSPPSGNPLPPSHTTGHPFTIATEQLGKKFNREWIFRNLSFTFESGQTYAITGPNGSGKSTLLQVLWGQMPASKGQVRYFRETVEVAAAEIYRHVAIATPYLDIIDEFTLTEQLQFHFKLKPAKGGMTVSEMIEKMNLTHAAHKFIGNFSSGMRQRVKLALAFFTEADVVFLDEPGTNLDNQAFSWYLDQLQQMPGNTLIMIASNQASEYPANAQKLDIMRFK